MNIQIPLIFKPLFNNELSKYRIIVYYGGRGGGKTENLMIYAIYKCLSNENINFYCAREIRDAKTNSLLAGFKRLIKQHNFIELGLVKNITRDYIYFYNGSVIVLIGVSKDTIYNLKGIDKVKYLWLEEAHNMSAEVMQILIPSVRADDSQILISLNPLSEFHYIYATYIKQNSEDYHISFKVNYTENPFFPEIMDRDRLNDYNTLPRHLYLHIWEGEPNDFNDKLVIDINKLGRYDDTLEFEYSQIILSLDTAYSVKTNADYSVICCIGVYNDEFHLFNMIRGRWDFFTLIIYTKDVYMQIHKKYKSSVSMLIENKGSGISLIQELQRQTNIPIVTTTPITDKFNRVVNDFLPHINKLKIPINVNDTNLWVNEFLRECNQFRSDGKHEHDDMIDSVSQALKYLNNYNIDYDNVKNIFKQINRGN